MPCWEQSWNLFSYGGWIYEGVARSRRIWPTHNNFLLLSLTKFLAEVIFEKVFFASVKLEVLKGRFLSSPRNSYLYIVWTFYPFRNYLYGLKAKPVKNFGLGIM